MRNSRTNGSMCFPCCWLRLALPIGATSPRLGRRRRGRRRCVGDGRAGRAGLIKRPELQQHPIRSVVVVVDGGWLPRLGAGLPAAPAGGRDARASAGRKRRGRRGRRGGWRSDDAGIYSRGEWGSWESVSEGGVEIGRVWIKG